MDAETLTMHEHVLRALKAIVAAYDQWLRQKRGAGTDRNGRCPQGEGKALQ